MVIENRHLSLREIANDLCVSHKTIRRFLESQLGMVAFGCFTRSRRIEFSSKNSPKESVAEDMLEHQ